MNNLSNTKVHTVNNVVEVQEQVYKFQTEGYHKDKIFVLTHDKDRTKRIVENTDAEKIGVAEEGFGFGDCEHFPIQRG